MSGIVFVVLGALIAGSSYLPAMNPPQCGDVVRDGCIIGANIGVGMAFVFGLLMVGIGLLVLLLAAVFMVIDKRAKNPVRMKYLALLAAAMIISVIILLL